MIELKMRENLELWEFYWGRKSILNSMMGD